MLKMCIFFLNLSSVNESMFSGPLSVHAGASVVRGHIDVPLGFALSYIHRTFLTSVFNSATFSPIVRAHTCVDLCLMQWTFTGHCLAPSDLIYVKDAIYRTHTCFHTDCDTCGTTFPRATEHNSGHVLFLLFNGRRFETGFGAGLKWKANVRVERWHGRGNSCGFVPSISAV